MRARSPMSVCLVFVVGLSLGGCAESKPELIAELDAGEGRMIRLYADGAPPWDAPTREFLYDANRGTEIQVSQRRIMFSSPDLRESDFLFIKAEGGNLVGVVEKERPKDMLILHEFSTGESWCSWEGPTVTGENLLRRLIQDTGDGSYTLSM